MTTPNPVTLSSYAMATRFELVLYGDDPVRLRAAGEEALREIDRLETQLSFYRADSEIRWINTHASNRPVKVEPRLFNLLKECASLTALTDGAFDITVGPLMRAWRFVNDTGRLPADDTLQAAREIVGVRHLQFDEEGYTLMFDRAGVEIDLGAYGKGYAIERAVEILKEAGITSALFHGGTSSVATIGTPPEDRAWRIGLSPPLGEQNRPAIINLADAALSVSALHGKSFTLEGRTFGHVIDPVSGRPTTGALAAAVRGPSAAICEALSTSLVVSGPRSVSALRKRFPDYHAIVAFEGEAGEIELNNSGIDDLPARNVRSGGGQ